MFARQWGRINAQGDPFNKVKRIRPVTVVRLLGNVAQKVKVEWLAIRDTVACLQCPPIVLSHGLSAGNYEVVRNRMLLVSICLASCMYGPRPPPSRQ
jgi:hypothetical protein